MRPSLVALLALCLGSTAALAGCPELFAGSASHPVFGPVVLGYYTLAFKLSDLIAVNIVRLLGSVLFPAFVWLASAVPERQRPAWLAGFMAVQALNATLFYTWRPLY